MASFYIRYWCSDPVRCMLLNHMCHFMLFALISTNYRVRIFIQKFITFFYVLLLMLQHIYMNELCKVYHVQYTIIYSDMRSYRIRRLGETIFIGYLRNPQYNNIWLFLRKCLYGTYPKTMYTKIYTTTDPIAVVLCAWLLM